MTAMELLNELRAANVQVWTDKSGHLQYEARPDTDPGLIRQLSSRTHELADFLIGADDCEASTQYVRMPDGVEIAVDLFHPKRGGTSVTEPLPAIWCHDRYRRSSVENDLLRTKFDSRPWLRAVMREGYVVAVADVRGSGASTGTRTQELSPQEAADAYELTEWLAAQSWCTGRVGMFGDSYLAIGQLLAASAAPPHLKAIVPQMVMFDLYDFIYPGGVFREDFVRSWSNRVRALDTGAGAVPVDGGQRSEGSISAEHEGNTDPFARVAELPFRDSKDAMTGECGYQSGNPASLREAINKSNIAVHQLSGWFDIWIRDVFFWHVNLGNPRRLTIDAASHTGREDVDLVQVHLDWFDHWLKDVPNTVMDEPPIRYRILNSREPGAWAQASQWPPPAVSTLLYLIQTPDGAGGLSKEAPAGRGGVDEFAVDYRATSGRTSRWANGYGADFGYGPMNGNDQLGMAYTSLPLPADHLVTGHPIMHLHISSSDPDGDFFVYLEDVDGDGQSWYVTEGVLRASARKVIEPPYANFGLPYHSGRMSDREHLPSLPVELVIDLLPTAYLFRAGSQIRLTVTGADRDNASTPRIDPPPVVQVHRDERFTSWLELPVMAAAEKSDD